MPVGAAIGAAGSVASSLIGGLFSKGAANKQIQAQNNALALQKQMFDTTQQNYTSTRDRINQGFEPFINTGQSATLSLAQLYGLATPGNPGGAGATGAYGPDALAAFYRSPDYGFARDAGMQALTFQDSAGGGGLLSRGHLNNTVQFGQGLATQQFGNYTGRLMSLAQLGAGSASNSANALTALTNGQAGNSASFANMGSNAFGKIGEAGAAGTLGVGNAIQNGIGGVTNVLGQYNMMNRGISAYGSGGAITSVPNSPNAAMYAGDPTQAGFGPTYGGGSLAPMAGIQWPTGGGSYW